MIDADIAEDEGEEDLMIDSTEPNRTVRSTSARCADRDGLLIHLFFSNDDGEIARSKAICASCGMQKTCLDGAIERAEPDGIWGGQIVHNGAAVARRPRRGRPRKAPPVAIAPAD